MNMSFEELVFLTDDILGRDLLGDDHVGTYAYSRYNVRDPKDGSFHTFVHSTSEP